jgi:hypothetical protein
MMGCSSGWELKALLHLVPTTKVIGIDSVPAMVQAARRNLAAGALQSDPQRATRILPYLFLLFVYISRVNSCELVFGSVGEAVYLSSVFFGPKEKR